MASAAGMAVGLHHRWTSAATSSQSACTVRRLGRLVVAEHQRVSVRNHKLQTLSTLRRRPTALKAQVEEEVSPENGIAIKLHNGATFDASAPVESQSSWLPAFPHVLTAAMANFMFGYHIGVMNGPLESIARELKFEGDTIMEGFVVSIFIVGAFLGSVGVGVLADKLGRRQTFELDAIPLVLGAALR